jgi:ribonuclease HI
MEAERTELAAIQTALGAVEFILSARENKKLLMIIVLWVIWTERNIIREEGRRRRAQDLARCVELYAHENLQQTQVQMVRQQAQRGHWTKPPVDTLKLNCDASFFSESGSGSWGALIRDSDGDPVLSGRGRMDHVLSPFHAELIACLQGIQMALNLGVSRLQVESDAQEVVKAINSDAYDMSVVGHLVEEIKSLASSNLISFEFVHVGRDCNRAAHELAALGSLCIEGEEVFTNSIPENVMVFVANDLLANE